MFTRLTTKGFHINGNPNVYGIGPLINDGIYNL